VPDLKPDGKWSDTEAPLIGVTPIMEWIGEHYGKVYAPNTRETIRRQTLHQFVAIRTSRRARLTAPRQFIRSLPVAWRC
jgi:BsuBI/PstI restriction endonuclease